MPGPIDPVGRPDVTRGVAKPQSAPQTDADFGALLRQAAGKGPSPAPLAPAAPPPVDLTATLERMQRVTQHLNQARAYFRSPGAGGSQIEADA